MLAMFRGAEEIRQKQMDWKAWIIRVLEGLTTPRSWTPYVLSGLSKDLYIINLLSMFILDLIRGLGKWKRGIEGFSFIF